ncbi:MAG: universal stress protein, partial [Streptosporangiales bacterium]|nr:universal stress protein [Streptosporangiales bacterium]
MAQEPAPIVVGIDGSEDGLQAVRWAAREAALRGHALRIVHAFIWPMMNVPLGPSPVGPQEGGLRHEAEGFVGEAIALARSTAPDVAITGDIVTGSAVPTLVDESHHAELVVVGSRGLGGFSGLLVGSVGVGTAAHASCPVVIVRGVP